MYVVGGEGRSRRAVWTPPRLVKSYCTPPIDGRQSNGSESSAAAGASSAKSSSISQVAVESDCMGDMRVHTHEVVTAARLRKIMVVSATRLVERRSQG